MKRVWLIFVFVCILTLNGCGHEHTWIEANCITPKTCNECGVTEGERLKHKWEKATCTTPKTCSICDKTDGNALGHIEGKWTVTQDATVYQVGVREQMCTVCGEVLKSEEFNPKAITYSEDFGMSISDFISIFNKLSDGDYEIKSNKNAYEISWLGFSDIGTRIGFSENTDGLITGISLTGSEMNDNGNMQSEVCWIIFRVLNPHLSSKESLDEFKYAAKTGGLEVIRGVRYYYLESKTLDTLFFDANVD